MLNKKAMSPLIATVLLVVFALLIGTATMSWGRNYVKNIEIDKGAHTDLDFKSSVIISYDEIDTPLKRIQIEYLKGKITLEEYLLKEKEVLEKE
jgi:hypothetical protein